MKYKLKLTLTKLKYSIDIKSSGDFFMSKNQIPAWLSEMETEELDFIKLFILASGSLKELAAHYEITYPTIRLRLDKLIQKIEVTENQQPSNMISLIKELTLQDKLDLDTAKQLIEAYQQEGDAHD